MIYADFNDELSSSYSHNTISLASIISKSQLPKFGLKASDLLNEKQMKKLKEIRKRHLKQDQELAFEKD